ncbi:MAG: glycosyltransferase family 4 protein, partial [Nitrososphaera sp.]|nr:glycosyltransferase family 4 protein [Nitrososphaera sp.]
KRQSTLIYTEHSEWEIERIPKKWRAIGGRLLKHIDGAVGVTPAVTRGLRQVLKVSDRVTSIILNGVDLDKFKSCRQNVIDIKRSLNIQDGELVIGTVGNLKRVKNHMFLIKAFGELVKAMRNVRLVIIGQGSPGDPENSEQELKDRVRELGVTDRVSFLDYRSDIAELMSVMDVFCLTSLKEGLPISLIEAMAAGLPVVGTNVEGIRDVIVPNQDGLLVELGDIEALKNALIDLLKNPDLRDRLGQAARQKAEETYSLKRCVHEYEALFLSTLNHSANRYLEASPH